MSIDAVASHGTLIGREHDSSGSPGTFTTIGDLGDITWPELMREFTETTAQNDGIDSKVPGVAKTGPLQFSINFIFDNATHDHSTGLKKAWLAKQFDGYKVTGADGSAGNHELIMSGWVASFAETAPARSGAATAAVSIERSGPIIIDGTTIS